MVKNVIIINDFGSVDGGATKVAINSAKLMAKSGINVIFFCAVKPIDKLLLESGVNVKCLDQCDILNNPNRIDAICQGLWNKKSSLQLKKILSVYSKHDTLVHIHTWTKAMSPSIWKVLACSGLKVVLTTHDYFTFCPNGGLYNYVKNTICEKTALSLGCLFCNCDSRNYAQKIWRFIRCKIQFYWMQKVEKLNVLSISQLNHFLCQEKMDGIVEKWFYLQNPIELNKASAVDVCLNDTYLFIGRLSQEKGISLFCEAISQLGLNGLVLGDGYLKDGLEKKYKNIRFVGWVTGREKESFLRQGKALIFPSLWYEGAPLTIQEMKSYARIQQASAKLRNVFVKALFWC